MNWKPVISFLLLLIVQRTDGLNHCQQKVCEGTNYGINGKPPENQERRLTELATMYANCSVVLNNLELIGLNHTDPEDLWFLQSIEEVVGYVLIYNNKNAGHIVLPNLKVIRGDRPLSLAFFDEQRLQMSHREFSLIVRENQGSTEVIFPQLRSISNGRVFWSSTQSCQRAHVDWRQIIGPDWPLRVEHYGDLISCNTTCSEKCPMDEHEQRYCWSAGDGHCQIVHRSCPPHCGDQSCYDTGSGKGCCHAECEGGCSGPHPSDCVKCKNSIDDGKCVPHCPSKTKYNRVTQKMESNPEGKYTYIRCCVKECPEHMSVYYQDHCVSVCPINYTEVNKKCEPCGGACPKRCPLDREVDGENIEGLKDCTEIDGSLVLAALSFRGDSGNHRSGSVLGITASQLANLLNIRQVTGYVVIQRGEGAINSSLWFLQNLETIEGRGVNLFRGKYALYVTHTSLEYLGLLKLRTIRNGGVWISDNRNMCLADALPWRQIVKDKESRTKSAIYNNRNKTLCNDEGLVCHSSCRTDQGCYGPGSNLCVQCKSWNLDEICVDSCREEEGFYNVSDKMCKRCDTNCSTCHGPGPFNCTTCKFVEDDYRCVQACPVKKFANQSRQCEPCHSACQSGCTGPGDFAGSGGCDKCVLGIIKEESHEHQLQCLIKTECPVGYFKDWRTENATWVCRRCDHSCRTCMASGTRHSVDDYCDCVNYLDISSDSCTNQCSGSTYEVKKNSATNTSFATCLPCSTTCDGCTGPSNAECKQCRKVKVEVRDPITQAVTVTCALECPTDQRFMDQDGFCRASKPTFLRSEAQAGIGIATCIVIVLLVIVIALAYCYRRDARNAKDVYSVIFKPHELEPLVGNGVANHNAQPNMSKLELLNENDLSIGDLMGSGAYGSVYKGIWYVRDKRIKVPVAIKCVLHDTPTAHLTMLDEGVHMARIQHPYLLKLIGVCMAPNQLMLVMPLMPLGSILEYVRFNKHRVGSAALLRWCQQIAAGMECLEINKVVHRDLAARNVLVRSPHHVCITDFGLAKMLDHDRDEVISMKEKMPLKWLALESLEHGRFTHKSDVWSFGVAMWEILTFGECPFKDVPPSELKSHLLRGERLPQPEVCTIDLYMMMVKCWMVDTESRPSFKHLNSDLSRMCKDPPRYLCIASDKLLRLPSYTAQDRTDMLRDMLQGITEDDEIQYAEEGWLGMSDTPPSSPTTPITPTKENFPQVARRTNHRTRSTASKRYASDPLNADRVPVRQDEATTVEEAGSSNVRRDSNNYLVPISSISNDSNSSPTLRRSKESAKEYYNVSEHVLAAKIEKRPDSAENPEYMQGSQRVIYPTHFENDERNPSWQ